MTKRLEKGVRKIGQDYAKKVPKGESTMRASSTAYDVSDSFISDGNWI